MNFEIEENRFKFSMKAKKPFIESPIEVSPHLLEIKSITYDSYFSYSYQNFWDLSVNESNEHFFFNFSILQTVSGSSNVSLMCHSREIASFDDIEINNIIYYPIGWSKVEHNFFDVLEIKDFSFFNQKFVYHTRIPSHFQPIYFDENISYEVINDIRNSENFCNAVDDHIFHENVTIFLYENSQNVSDFLVSYILPIHLYINYAEYNKVFLLNNETYLCEDEFEKRKNNFLHFVNNVSFIDNKRRSCFRNGIIINRNSSKTQNIYEKFFYIIQNEKFNLTSFHARFKTTKKIDALNETYDNEPHDNETNDNETRDNETQDNETLNEIEFLSDVPLDHISYELFDITNPNYLNITLEEIYKKLSCTKTFIISKIENMPFCLFLRYTSAIIQIGNNKTFGLALRNVIGCNYSYYNTILDYQRYFDELL